MNKPTTIQTSSPLNLQPCAFTLAEIMIVFAIIGILTAILLPAARNSTPNENIMKFKKAHNTLHNTIRELVNSDKYYLNGDLGVKVDGTLIDGTHEHDTTYLCNTIADILNAKKVDCKDNDTAASGYRWQMLSNKDLAVYKEGLDTACMRQSLEINSEIISQDNIIFYQTAPGVTFGMNSNQAGNTFCTGEESCKERLFLNYSSSSSGFMRVYKIFCIDIDGIPLNATRYNCVNECPFGYGIRVDGKILNGLRADEWLEKTI